MKSIILYPDKDRYVLKRIFKIFNSQSLKVDACSIDRSWSIEQLTALTGLLDGYSHIFVILSSENFTEPWFVNISGYISGSKKECFFYFTENNKGLNKFFSNFNTGQGYSDVLSYAKEESIRWAEVIKKTQSRNYLIDRGFALSEDAMGECVTSSHLDIVKNYLDAGYSPSCRNSKGVPLLCLAVRANHQDIISYLIEVGADINAVSDDRNNTPLMDAASSGQKESVVLLVNEGANLECQSKNGQTALILSVGHGDVDVSNYLLSVGSDFEIKDFLGMSAKSYATLFNKKEILEKMI